MQKRCFLQDRTGEVIENKQSWLWETQERAELTDKLLKSGKMQGVMNGEAGKLLKTMVRHLEGLDPAWRQSRRPNSNSPLAEVGELLPWRG
ncbi:MAG: hypothetical protein ACRD2O_08280 [Terriglobia bacterium]